MSFGHRFDVTDELFCKTTYYRLQRKPSVILYKGR